MSNKTKKKRNAVEWAMHYRQIIILITACLVAFGIYILPEMRWKILRFTGKANHDIIVSNFENVC